jgi:TonB-linked SusC/RagA family outer membrane protein
MRKHKRNFPKLCKPGSGFRAANSAIENTRRHIRSLWLICLGALMFAIPLNAQNLTVTGRVTDPSGMPLPGVTVVIKGTPPIGTTTTADGNYSLKNVSSDAVISFSFIGYKTVEVSVEGRTVVNVQLLEDVTAIDEVIINAGYYSVKDRERTGSIARVTADEIKNQPVSNVLAAAQGRMAGVSITQNSGLPGSGYKIQIRGVNSLRRTGNYPMYIIDGVPISAETPSSVSGTILPYGEIDPLNVINPNDIQNIEILKDADATAIYGSRGANGVILITTRSGKAGQKPSFSVTTGYGLGRVASKLELLNTEQYLGMRRQAFANDGITTYPANAYDINGTWDETRYTDWQKELIGETAINSAIQLSVGAGNKNTGFLISGSHNEQTTVFAKDFRYKTNNLSGSLNHRSDNNRFTLNAAGLFSAQTNNLIRTDISKQSLMLSPNAPALYKEDGSLNWENNTFTNPVAANLSTYGNDNKTFNVNLNMGYELFRSFSVKFNGGFNYRAFNEIGLRPNTIYNPAYGITPANSSATRANHQQFSYLLEPQLNYRKKFGNHELDVLVGGTFQQTQTAALELYSYGFKSNALITSLSAASNVSVNSDQKKEYKYAALFGRVNYNYKNRYIMNLTGRRDGSSRFGPENRFANFGAVGIAWLFSEESILKESKWMSFGKLRASFGVTGSDLIGDYQYLDTYTVSSTLYGGSTSLYPTRLFNPYFSWEKTTKLEIALETGFFNDRVRLDAAWYRNRSGNQLVGIPLPTTTGFSSVQANLPATVENKGFEAELRTTPVLTGNFKWNSSINISIPRNKLLSFPGLEGSTYANTYVTGYPVSIVKVYNYEGIDPETGLYTFTDYNEDGNISSPEDNRVIEDVGIRYFGGWSNQFSFKQWDFSFLLQFVSQRQSNYNSLMPFLGAMYNQPVEVLDVWSVENPDGRYMPYSAGYNPEKSRLTGYFKSSNATISDASFIRLKNIQLSYRLQVDKSIKEVLVYVQGQNLLTLTDYFGLDPEFNLTGYLPPLKTWSLGFQLNF